MLRAVLAPATDVRFDNVSTVKEGHFSIRLYPDLVTSVWGDNVEGGYVEAEFACFGELACSFISVYAFRFVHFVLT